MRDEAAVFVAGWAPPDTQGEPEPVERLSRRAFLSRRLEFEPVDAMLSASLIRSMPPPPIQERLGALAKVHREWARKDGPLATEAVDLLWRSTGFDKVTLAQHLRHLFYQMSGARLREWIPTALRYRVLARGPALGIVIAGGDVPGTSLPTVVQLLLLGSAVVVRLSTDEPVLATLYARSLAQIAPELAARLIVTGWEPDDESEARWLQGCDQVVVYGGPEAVAHFRGIAPPEARILVYGHRVSHAFVAREAVYAGSLAATCRAVALDHVEFDQHGCLAPQVVFQEEHAAFRFPFAEPLVRNMKRLQEQRPRRPLSAGDAAQFHQYRARAELRPLSVDGAEMYGGPEDDFTVAVDPHWCGDPGPGNRTVIVRPVMDVDDAGGLVSHLRGSLLSVTLAAPPERYDRLAAELLALGYTRVAPAGRAQRPCHLDLHDGLHGPHSLARFTCVE